MDSLSASFVILMVVLGGVSAYVADILGYKIGKKRLSLWHIRPKYVARTAVVIAGALIPLLVVALWYAASAGFRTWITKGQQAIEDAKQATAQVQRLQDQAVKLTKTKNSLDNQNHILDSQNNQKQKDIDRQDAKLKLQADSLKSLSANLKDLQAKIEKANKLNLETKRQFESTQASLKKSEASLESVQNLLVTAKANLDATNDRYKELRGQYDQTSSRNLELTNANFKLENANNELQKNLKEVQSQIESLTKEINSLKLDKTSADREANDARQKRDEIQNKLNEVTIAMRQAFQDSEYKFRTYAVEFRLGEELGRAPIPAKLSRDEAISLYRSLLRKGRSIATERGATPDTSLPFSSNAGFILTDSTNRTLGDDEVEDFWVSRFTSFKSDQVVVMNSAMNRIAGEALVLRFDIYPNPIVFRKGEIVAESKVDGRSGDQEIRDSIRDFLRTYVNTKARMRKMIPVRNGSDESYGQLSEDQFFDTFMRVRTITRVVRLVAVAQEDTRAGDPLRISLELR